MIEKKCENENCGDPIPRGDECFFDGKEVCEKCYFESKRLRKGKENHG